ncbi:MAG: hypothetical protein HC938_06780 [Nitrospira sp.]|nr:hypothetical protein [Nitrospira sp.]
MLYGLNGRVVRVALPRLVRQKTQVPFERMTLTDSNGRPVTVSSELAQNVTALADKSLSERLPAITVKALARAATKFAMAEGITRGAQHAAGRDAAPWVGLLVELLTKGIAVASEEADKRSWQTLPDEIHVLERGFARSVSRVRSTVWAQDDGEEWTRDIANCRPNYVHHSTCVAMTDVRGSILGQGMAICICLCSIVSITSGCTWGFGKGKPTWVDGQTSEYPPTHYLTGVGQADNRSGAEDQAYAAVARIFKAEVASQVKDWESYVVVENHGIANAKRRLTIDSVTQVSTDKVLENVRIMDNWYDSDHKLHHALAVMNRSQADASLTDKVLALDGAIAADITEARQTTDKLVKVRALLQAGRNVVLREAYNTDLRVIRVSGQGTPSAYRANELFSELEQFLATNLVLAVQVSGDQVELAQRALVEGLLREGLHVTTKPNGTDAGSPELLVRGTVRLFPIDVGDPQFKYVRWCSDSR